MNNQAVYAMLGEAGFTAGEIARLQQLERVYAETKSGQERDLDTITLEDAMNEADNAMKDEEAYNVLKDVGFTAEEIARLQQLRQAYVEETSATHRRHTFVAWLETASHKAFGETYPEWTIYQ